MNIEWISIKTMLEDYESRTAHSERGGEDISDFILTNSSDAIIQILPADVFTFGIQLIRIENYRGELPKGFKRAVQVAANLELPDSKKLRDTIVQWNQELWGTDCELEIKMNYSKCGDKDDCDFPPILIDVDRIYQNSHPEMFTKHYKHFTGFAGFTYRGGARRSCYHPAFQLIKPSTNNFFSTKYHIPGCLNLQTDNKLEYTLEPPVIRTNFEKGTILLAYLSIPMDEDGLPLIPNLPSVFAAINAFVMQIEMTKRWYNSGTPNDRVNMQYATQERERLISRARIELTIPGFSEMWTHVQNHHRKTLPYYNFEENLNRFQRDQFNFPQI